MKNKEPESSPLPSKVGGMTLQECKDHVAISYGFRNWSEINFYEIGERLAQVDAPFDEEMIFDETAELYASQFKSPDSPLNPSSVSKEEESGWPAIQKFMADEISYLKSCNPEDRFGGIENKFAAGMICAYERVQREHEDLLRKATILPTPGK